MSCCSIEHYHNTLLCNAKTAFNNVKGQLEDAHNQKYLDNKDPYLKEKPSDLLAKFQVNCFFKWFLANLKQLMLPLLIYVGK